MNWSLTVNQSIKLACSSPTLRIPLNHTETALFGKALFELMVRTHVIKSALKDGAFPK
jgi:23S rRNA maturation mini-RNase III